LRDRRIRLIERQRVFENPACGVPSVNAAGVRIRTSGRWRVVGKIDVPVRATIEDAGGGAGEGPGEISVAPWALIVHEAGVEMTGEVHARRS